MILDMDIQKAMNFASIKHSGQLRKGTDIPYIVHPFSVGMLIMSHTTNKDAIIAGLLHDVLEDTNTSEEELEMLFGKKFFRLLKSVLKRTKRFHGKIVKK